MNIFDLLFLALFSAAAATLLAAGAYALRGEFRKGLQLLKRLGIGAAAYSCAVIGVSLAAPRKSFAVGMDQCFDDWCIRVESYRAVPEKGNIAYTVNLRISSRAKRVSQREKNLGVYLTDEEGKRYDASADQSAGEFDVLLAPGESAKVSRSFEVPAGAKHVGVVVAHQGGFPIGWFIIGYDTWFRKPAVVWLESGAGEPGEARFSARPRGRLWATWLPRGNGPEGCRIRV